ncbi:T9SS type A sorting domain-containing protein [bacterium]|nr:T9SS type A sorting domain-containing protein [bacterium]
MSLFRVPLLACLLLILFGTFAAVAQDPGDRLWDDTYTDVLSLASLAPAATGQFIHVSARDSLLYLRWVDSDGTRLQTVTIVDPTGVDVRKIVPHPDGGFILVGKTNATTPDVGDAMVMRIDAAGTITWQQSWAVGNNDEASNVLVDEDGNIIVVGRVGDYLSGYDGFLWKLTPDGVTIWQNPIGGHDDDFIEDIIPAIGGGYLAVGRTYSIGAGSSDGWAVKTSTDGVIQWEQAYGTDGFELLACATVCDGNYMFGGRMGPGFNTAAWVVCADDTGLFQWDYGYGQSGWNGFNRFLPTGDGNVAFCGAYQGNDSTWLLWVGELTPAGTLNWESTHGFMLTISATGLDFCPVDGGGYVICGQGNNNGWLVSVFDFPDTVPPLTVSATPINEPLVLPASGGNFRWIATVENSSDLPVTFDAWTSATTPNGTEVGPLQQISGITVQPGFTASAAPRQSVPFYAPAGTYTYTLYVGDGNDIIAESSFTFEKLPGQTAADAPSNWTATGMEFATSDASELTQPRQFEVLSVYPNPFNAQATITVHLPASGELAVTVNNISGQQVAVLARGRTSAGTHQFTLDANHFASGIYFVHATLPDGMNEIRRVALIR